MRRVCEYRHGGAGRGRQHHAASRFCNRHRRSNAIARDLARWVYLALLEPSVRRSQTSNAAATSSAVMNALLLGLSVTPLPPLGWRRGKDAGQPQRPSCRQAREKRFGFQHPGGCRAPSSLEQSRGCGKARGKRPAARLARRLNPHRMGDVAFPCSDCCITQLASQTQNATTKQRAIFLYCGHGTI